MRKGLRIIGQEDFLHVLEFETLRSHSRGDDRFAHRRRFQNLQSRSAADPKRDHTDRGLGDLRRHIRHRSGELDIGAVVEFLSKRLGGRSAGDDEAHAQSIAPTYRTVRESSPRLGVYASVSMTFGATAICVPGASAFNNCRSFSEHASTAGTREQTSDSQRRIFQYSSHPYRRLIGLRSYRRNRPRMMWVMSCLFSTTGGPGDGILLNAYTSSHRITSNRSRASRSRIASAKTGESNRTAP